MGKEGGAASRSKAAMDSDATAQLLERAALTLLERDGVLAGLNLREVADLAGVNRGLVYHYFGSRQDLLRAALRRTADTHRKRLLIDEAPTRYVDRMRQVMRGAVRQAAVIRLRVLLLLDDDRTLPMMPLRDITQQRLAGDREAGLLPEDADTVALHALLRSVATGYVLNRPGMAKEFGIGVKELDARMESLLDRLCAAVDGPSAADSERASSPAE